MVTRQACYTPSAEELDLAARATRGQSPRLGLLELLKVFQQLHYFPYLDTIPTAVVDHIRVCAGLDPGTPFGYDRKVSPILFRHYGGIVLFARQWRFRRGNASDSKT
nr:DUF4158 domain-containing protein [Ralstonia solanacearum]